MTLREHLEAIIEAVPSEGSVTLPVSTLQRWVAEDGAVGSSPTSLNTADLTVERVAEALGVGLSWARDVIRENEEELGAYRRGRRWYVPVSGLTRWQRTQSQEYRRRRTGTVDAREVDLDALRRELREDA